MTTRILLTFLISLFAGSTFIATAQQRDHLTEQEVDLVKEAQALDKRIDVFIRAAERRLMVINGSGNAAANTHPNRVAGSHCRLVALISFQQVL